MKKLLLVLIASLGLVSTAEASTRKLVARRVVQPNSGLTNPWGPPQVRVAVPVRRPMLSPSQRRSLRMMVQNVMRLERAATRLERMRPQQAWRLREQAESIRDQVAQTCSRFMPPCP